MREGEDDSARGLGQVLHGLGDGGADFLGGILGEAREGAPGGLGQPVALRPAQGRRERGEAGGERATHPFLRVAGERQEGLVRRRRIAGDRAADGGRGIGHQVVERLGRGRPVGREREPRGGRALGQDARGVVAVAHAAGSARRQVPRAVRLAA